jgi:hypothetical protein
LQQYKIYLPSELHLRTHAYLSVGTWTQQASNLSNELLSLLGFAIGDGSVSGNQAIFHLRRERKIIYLSTLASKLGFELKNNKSDYYVIALDKSSAKLFHEIVADSGEKQIPEKLLLQLSNSQSQALLDGLINSDGSVCEDGVLFDTSSKRLCDQVQQLALHCGKCSKVSTAQSLQDRSGSLGNKRMYRQVIHCKLFKPHIRYQGGPERGKTEWVSDFSGKVWCVQVPTGIVYVRRRGIPCWSGNSVVAHGHVTYAIEDCSRVFSHEIVRNWVGNERSQESLRYVRLTDLRFWIPPIISGDFPGGAYPTKTLAGPPILLKYLNALPGMHLSPKDIFEIVIEMCEWGQAALATYYDIENVPDFETKKKLTSAFRRIAPLGLATGIGISFNLRSLRWVIEQRTHESAEEEMRLIMGMVAEDAMRRWPMVFADFKKIDTGDGLYKYVPEYSKI